MSLNSRPLLVITGPTGIGKTDLAMALAEESPLRIISADSVMVYQHLDIGSAKPSKSQLEQYPHDLIDVVPPEHPFDAGQFVEHARQSIEGAWSSDKIPCLVGGTIMYLKSLLDGLDPMPPADPEIREMIRHKASEDGWPSVHAWLSSLDADAAQLIHPNHSSRIERALEVYLKTGQSIRSFWSNEKENVSINDQAFDLSVLALVPTDREQLKVRLNRRFDLMLEHGLTEEVHAFRERPGLSLQSPSMRSVGYRQMWKYLDGDLSETEMKEQAKAATRQLAKRQLTWLRSWRAATNTVIGVSDSIPHIEGKTWLSRVIDRVL